GQFLKTDGAGALAFATPGGAPGGATGAVQFNNAGAFGGDAAFTWDNIGSVLHLGESTVDGNLMSGGPFVIAENNSARLDIIQASSAPDSPAVLLLSRSRGSVASPTSVAEGDTIGRMRWQATQCSGGAADIALV